MDMGRDGMTAFGRWAEEQPRGVLSRAMRATGFAYSTIHAATKRRMSRDVAVKLARFTRYEVKASEIVVCKGDGEAAQ